MVDPPCLVSQFSSFSVEVTVPGGRGDEIRASGHPFLFLLQVPSPCCFPLVSSRESVPPTQRAEGSGQEIDVVVMVTSKGSPG